MPFPYYRRLAPRDQAIYRKSAAVHEVALPDAAELRPLVVGLHEALESGVRARTQRAANALVLAITEQLRIPPVSVRVLARRPSSATSELHGLYTLDEGEATIRVWMKTAAHEKVVSFRTFLRTLLHEVCHHLDFLHFRWPESFHTEGFFKRESSLMRQLVLKKGKQASAGAGRKSEAPASRPLPEPPRPRGDRQLALPFV